MDALLDAKARHKRPDIVNLVTRLVIYINAPEITGTHMTPYKQTIRHDWPLLRSEQ